MTTPPVGARILNRLSAEAPSHSSGDNKPLDQLLGEKRQCAASAADGLRCARGIYPRYNTCCSILGSAAEIMRAKCRRLRCESLTGAVPIAALERRICAEVRFPKSIHVDPDPEFVSKGSRHVDVRAPAALNSTSRDRASRRTTPLFRAKFSAERHSAHWFLNLADAQRNRGGG